MNVEKTERELAELADPNYAEKAKINVELVLTHNDGGKVYTEEFSIMKKLIDIKKFYNNCYDTPIDEQEIKLKDTQTNQIRFSLGDDQRTLDDYGIP